MLTGGRIDVSLLVKRQFHKREGFYWAEDNNSYLTHFKDVIFKFSSLKLPSSLKENELSSRGIEKEQKQLDKSLSEETPKVSLSEEKFYAERNQLSLALEDQHFELARISKNILRKDEEAASTKEPISSSPQTLLKETQSEVVKDIKEEVKDTEKEFHEELEQSAKKYVDTLSLMADYFTYLSNLSPPKINEKSTGEVSSQERENNSTKTAASGLSQLIFKLKALLKEEIEEEIAEEKENEGVLKSKPSDASGSHLLEWRGKDMETSDSHSEGLLRKRPQVKTLGMLLCITDKDVDDDSWKVLQKIAQYRSDEVQRTLDKIDPSAARSWQKAGIRLFKTLALLVAGLLVVNFAASVLLPAYFMPTANGLVFAGTGYYAKHITLFGKSTPVEKGHKAIAEKADALYGVTTMSLVNSARGGGGF